MRKIQLQGGHKEKFAILDDEDYPLMSKFKWYYVSGYARRIDPKTGKGTFMHRDILQPPATLLVDHKNKNKLDNRRENLRVCTHAQNYVNSCTRRKKTSHTSHRGITKNSAGNWHAVIRCRAGVFSLGVYTDELSAAQAYDYAAWLVYGDFHVRKFPEAGVEVLSKKLHGRGSVPVSGFRGAHKSYAGKWASSICANGKRTHLGIFDSPEQAAQAYDLAAIKHFGCRAITNFGVSIAEKLILFAKEAGYNGRI